MKLLEKLPVVISLILFILPFFWIAPGTLDLGGDASRLYFYDPISYIKNMSFYIVITPGAGTVYPGFFLLPYALLIEFLLELLHDKYLVISIFSGIKLSVAFLSMYMIIANLLKDKRKELYMPISIISAIFYILSPVMTGNWDKAFISHDQVFINPLIFLLFYKYLQTKNFIYLLTILPITFIFSTSFSLASAPPFFAFFPLAIIYLLIIFLFIRKERYGIFPSISFIALFLGLQSFHLIPQLLNILEPESLYNTRLFDPESMKIESVNYFSAISSIAKVSRYILLPIELTTTHVYLFLVPIIVVSGLILKKKPSKEFLLTGVFFIITLFLLSGNITELGNSFYKSLFYIPGFSMFRNFIGQWLFVYGFFYALLFAYSMYYLCERLNKEARMFLFFLILFVLILGSINFINGSMLNKQILQNPKAKTAVNLDYALRELNQITTKFGEGKILYLPLSDSIYQVIVEGNGAYIGPSIISYLVGKNDFSGYQHFVPFSEHFLKFGREKNYDGINRLLYMLNINYIILNKDLNYEKIAPDPFSYVKESLPKTVSGYKEFINGLGAEKIEETQRFLSYKVKRDYFSSHIFSSSDILITTVSSKLYPLEGINLNNKEVLITGHESLSYISKLLIDKNTNGVPEISSTKVNPIMYKVEVKNSSGPFMLVLSESYDSGWRVYLVKDRPLVGNLLDNFGFVEGQEISKNKHFKANYYANGWAIDGDYGKGFTLILVQTKQRIFFFSLIITFASLGAVFAMWILYLKNIIAKVT